MYFPPVRLRRTFEAPMAPHGLAALTRITRERGDVVAALDGELIPKVAFGFHHANDLEVGPLGDLGQGGKHRCGPVPPHLNASMPTLGFLVVIKGDVSEMSPLRRLEKVNNGLMELPLIPFDRQHIIGAFLSDLLRDLRLTTHRIQRDNTAL